jgi:hypothetical protein
MTKIRNPYQTFPTFADSKKDWTMFTIRLIVCLLFGTWMVGCSNGQQNNIGDTSTVEYILSKESESVKILLTTEGAARIDLQSEIGNNRRACTVLVPTNAKEVAKLARAISALIDVGIENPPITVLDVTPMPGFGNTIIHCQIAGREKKIQIDTSIEEYDLIWQGVRKQIEAVALLKIVTAVDAYDQGEILDKKGDVEGAIDQYDKAMKAFMDWTHERIRRYEPYVIYEPEIALGFKYSINEHVKLIVNAIPDKNKNMEEPGMTKEISKEFFRFAWKKCTSIMTVSHRDGVVVVGFIDEGGLGGWNWGLTVKTIPSNVIEQLIKFKWSTDEIKK